MRPTATASTWPWWTIRRNHPSALDPAIKSCNLLNNILAVREAQARGAEEALLLNDRGELAEGASTNVFVVKDGAVRTPPLAAGILAGITRDVLFGLIRDLRLPSPRGAGSGSTPCGPPTRPS